MGRVNKYTVLTKTLYQGILLYAVAGGHLIQRQCLTIDQVILRQIWPLVRKSDGIGRPQWRILRRSLYILFECRVKHITERHQKDEHQRDSEQSNKHLWREPTQPIFKEVLKT